MKTDGGQRKSYRDLKKMGIKDAAQYIWDYYKIGILGIIVLIGLLCYFISIFLNRPEDEILNIAFVNFYDDLSEDSVFYRDFEDTLDPLEQGRIVFDCNYFFNLEKTSDVVNTYYQKMVANIDAKISDAIICEYANIQEIGASGRLLDLQDDRVSSIYNKYKDRMIAVDTEEGPILIGIDISDSKMWENLNGYEEACYLGISSKVVHIDMLEKFLDYILD